MKPFLLISCCALLAGGCAISPEPLSETELSLRVPVKVDRDSG